MSWFEQFWRKLMAILRGKRSAPVLAHVLVAPATADVEIGQTQQYAAQGRDQYGDPFQVTVSAWKSSNPAVATITPAGLATVKAEGETIITATVNGQDWA